jgi:formylglycine-generating enzyme required for sulfatase activity
LLALREPLASSRPIGREREDHQALKKLALRKVMIMRPLTSIAATLVFCSTTLGLGLNLGSAASELGDGATDKAPRLAQTTASHDDQSNIKSASETVGSIAGSRASSNAKALTPPQECALQPHETFKECVNCPEMSVVAAGSFMMGSPSTERQRSRNEGPQHNVTFAQPFAVGKFAVTLSEWDACVSDGGCGGYTPNDLGWGRDRHPAIYVSWSDAEAYLAWLSKKVGKPYRLLSEAEWEYVARAGTATPYWFGASISPQQANYDSGATAIAANDKHANKTVPVDAFDPNPWGLFQVHGNVSEWTEDCYNENYEGAPADGSAWTGGDCTLRVVRGGSLVDYPKYLRAASRDGDPAEFRTLDTGFRVARNLCPH